VYFTRYFHYLRNPYPQNDHYPQFHYTRIKSPRNTAVSRMRHEKYAIENITLIYGRSPKYPRLIGVEKHDGDIRF